jgi:ferredoxin
MKKIDFKVTFLSDIVLNSSSNTQGNIETLDYITGASFLGMVAKNYNDFENSFKVFHSANVRFGEATPLFENKPTYKVPFCFFHPKLDENKKEVKNNHFIKYEDEIELNKQYKQVRSGYITSNLDYINLDYVYSQKAAYDKTNRKSKDSSMFGYKAIKKGATWKFSIKFDDIDEKTQNQVIENILGEKYLGKSKTAQYGKVLIEEIVTVSGRGISTAKNYRVPIGTRIKEILDEVGFKKEITEKLLTGGPMMGISQYTDEVPVIKGTSGILALTKEETNPYKSKSCISCGKCVEVCPMGLSPLMYAKFAEFEKWEEFKEYNVFDCIECGSCQFICPAKRPLTEGIRVGKTKLRSMDIK